jgi:hypothetical protein
VALFLTTVIALIRYRVLFSKKLGGKLRIDAALAFLLFLLSIIGVVTHLYRFVWFQRSTSPATASCSYACPIVLSNLASYLSLAWAAHTSVCIFLLPLAAWKIHGRRKRLVT